MVGQSCLWLLGTVLLLATTKASDHDPQMRKVFIDQGPVIGHKDANADIFVFYDIPYATAPTGTNKFKAPLPPPTWKAPFDAVNRRIACPQIKNPLSVDTIKQEDCLVASVYVPNTKEINLPVYVAVHGGGFQKGYGNIISKKELMRTKEFILVTFNYRLGIHGFLCLGTEKVQGNAGMKDQVALLRWVKRNIASFGGNPDDVTLGGWSGGAASSDLLYLSPSTRGLFNKVIPESGISTAVFSVLYDPIENAKEYARSLLLLNYTETDDIYALENFFTSASYEQLTNIEALDVKTDSTTGTGLCVERPAGEEIFIDDAPFNILKSGSYKNLPMLVGLANFEANFQTLLFEDWGNRMNDEFSEFLPADLQFNNQQERDAVSQKIKDFYFGNQIIGENTIHLYVNYFSDIMFTYPVLKSLELRRLHGNDKLYLYEYTYYEGDGTPLGYKDYKINGAIHCGQTSAVDDGVFEFSLGTNNFADENTLPDDYKQIKAIIRDMWRNFITKGEPVSEGSSLPTWPPMGADWSPHMSLGRKVELKGSLMLERIRFWDSIYEKHRRLPVAPPRHPPRHVEL